MREILEVFVYTWRKQFSRLGHLEFFISWVTFAGDLTSNQRFATKSTLETAGPPIIEKQAQLFQIIQAY